MTVTLPANTRFYVVLQKSAIAVAPTPAAVPSRQSVEMPTVQELRELMDLRREINRMYQESNSGLRGGKPQVVRKRRRVFLRDPFRRD